MYLVHPVVGTNNKEISTTFSSFTEHENDEEQDDRANSDESSSIGSPSSSSDDDDDEEEEEEIRSKESSFSSFASSLEESLPIKRGLSSYFSGKTKSFTDLSGCANAAVEDYLSKPENPFNKRRRILTSWSRRASCSSLIVVQEEAKEEKDDDENEDNNYGGGEEGRGRGRGRGRAFPSFPPPIPRLRGGDNRKINNIGFRPSFSLSDLQTSCRPNFSAK